MNSLVDLKNIFRQNRVPVTESGGWYFTCKQDIWSMLDGEYYLNNVKIDKKGITSYIQLNKVYKQAKKITPNVKEEKNASESD